MRAFKFLLSITFLAVCFDANAAAVSLESALSSQEQLTISPVMFEGVPVYGSPDGLCAMLGYTRVVKSQKSEYPLAKDAKYFRIQNNDVLGAKYFEKQTTCAGCDVYPFESVVCAR